MSCEERSSAYGAENRWKGGLDWLRVSILIPLCPSYCHAASWLPDNQLLRRPRAYPDRYPKKFLPDHFLRGPLPRLRTDSCTLSFYEPTDPKQLSNITIRWVPLNKYTFVPVETEGAGWRFIAFVEGYAKDLEARIKRNLEIREERKKNPDRYPKKFLEDHWLMSPLPTLSRDSCGLAFYETDDPKQLTNIAMRRMPLMKFSFTHIAESTAAVEILREITKMKL